MPTDWNVESSAYRGGLGRNILQCTQHSNIASGLHGQMPEGIDTDEDTTRA